MKPANDPNVDYKALVQKSYDLCAAAYEEARRKTTNPEVDSLITLLPEEARVLDIGCGAGVPIAQSLANHFHLTGVDISGEQIRRAKLNVPAGNFIHGDIMSANFTPASFDAVVAFYSIFHLPREEHSELLRRIRTWLKAGGYLLATFTKFSESAYTEDDFFDVTMYWSNYGLSDYKALLIENGFRLLESTVTDHGYTDAHQASSETHPILFAQAA
jgi:SAM-dependent methyltransferase